MTKKRRDRRRRSREAGHRPVLIVSPADFHAATKLPVAPPITAGGDPARRIGFAVPASGIKTTGIVRCDEFHVLDPQARDGRKVDALPAAILDDVLAKPATIFA